MSEPTVHEEIEEIWKLFKETDAKFKETETKFKETDAKFKETDARMQRQSQETDAALRRLEGIFGIQWGRMLEALVAPAALELFRERGIDVHTSYQRQRGRVNGESMELDIVLENDHQSVVIEVKSLVKVEDVDDFLEDLHQIPHYFTRFGDRRIYGAIAGLEFAGGADRYAYQKGLFVLGLTGEGLVSILNDDHFRPIPFGAGAAGR